MKEKFSIFCLYGLLSRSWFLIQPSWESHIDAAALTQVPSMQRCVPQVTGQQCVTESLNGLARWGP